MVIEKRLRELESLMERTQPLPWKSFVEGRDHTGGSDFIMTGESHNRGSDIEFIGGTVADQDFIALARQLMPELIAEIRRLREIAAN